MAHDIDCPYCDSPQEINHDDGAGYAEGVTHSQECGNCGKTFAFETSISFYYEAKKADCLNEGGAHTYKPTTTVPKFFTRMRCSQCDDERQPTDEEKIKYEIPLTYNPNN